jgi:hypothetical protein
MSSLIASTHLQQEAHSASEGPDVEQTELSPWDADNVKRQVSPTANGDATADAIKTEAILIQGGTLLPESLLLESEPYASDWTPVWASSPQDAVVKARLRELRRRASYQLTDYGA